MEKKHSPLCAQNPAGKFQLLHFHQNWLNPSKMIQ